ncbi:hypothetical protein LINGRAHAP2_LOCUS1989 [Linum grandiflorum]
MQGFAGLGSTAFLFISSPQPCSNSWVLFVEISSATTALVVHSIRSG